MIVVIWGVAFFVCIAPMAGWKDPGWEDRIFKNQVSENNTPKSVENPSKDSKKILAMQFFATANIFFQISSVLGKPKFYLYPMKRFRFRTHMVDLSDSS